MRTIQIGICVIVLLCFRESLSSLVKRDLEWWETTIIYQLYPRSFKDTNGDGVGDLNGIIEKLDYIRDNGIETIWIQPFYKSPMADMGYDVADYKQVDPIFGTMDDAKRLIKGIHDRGMKLVMDFVPNHVSRESEWFRLSENKVHPYTDYFIWKDPKPLNSTHTTVPNNWLSIFGGSAWEWSDKRKQYFFKQFSAKQPDLNFRSQDVLEEMRNVLRFWLDLGVDGFRIDAIKHLVEAEHLKDEPQIDVPIPGSNNYATLDHIYTVSQPENYEITHDWSLIMDEYKQKDGKIRILATEDYDTPEKMMIYLGNSTYKGVQIPFYFLLVDYDFEQNTTVLDQIIHDWADALAAKSYLPNWVIGNHDNLRPATRLSSEGSDAFNILELMLPGQASVYYGDELGLEDSLIRKDQIKDPNNKGIRSTASRDYSRAPMIWDDTKNAGFTTNKKPWLPIHPSYWIKNVKSQLQQPISHLKNFRRLTALRNTKVMKYGALNTYLMGDWLYMFTRTLENETTVVVVVNLGSETDSVCAKNYASELPDTLTVHTASLNAGFNIGDRFQISNANGVECSELRPKGALVLTAGASHGVLLTGSICLVVVTVFVNFLQSFRDYL